jgi:predicted amidophosphoribosyltransferase
MSMLYPHTTPTPSHMAGEQVCAVCQHKHMSGEQVCAVCQHKHMSGEQVCAVCVSTSTWQVSRRVLCVSAQAHVR